jgi:anti-anti-sigma factor
VVLRATALADRLHLTVIDTGSWKTADDDPNSIRGRGIRLTNAFMQDVTMLRASGELDMSNIDVFAAAVTDALGAASLDGGLLTVDLCGVEYLDSGAINALFRHAERIRLIVNPILMPVLKLSGLTDVISVEAEPTASDN